MKVRNLGGFEVVTEHGPLAGRANDARKASSKPLELLRYLAAQGHATTRVDEVAAALWPGDGREGRQKAFDVTVARLRRLLDCELAVTIYDHRAGLHRGHVWVDVAVLNEALSQAEASARDSAAAGQALEAALALYRGPCMADSMQGWAVAAAERLRVRLAATLLRAMRGAAPSQAREWALRATAADPRLGLLVGPSPPL